MYPYREGVAGRLRSRHKTTETSEALLAGDEIVSLAEELLSKEAHGEAEELSSMLAGTRTQKAGARLRLMTIVQPHPKRPMAYCQIEVQFLPRWTRNVLRYLGDYIDMLVKAAVFEKTRDRSIFRTSLGPAIDRFETAKAGNQQLADWLRRYNRFLYRPAKHDMTLPADRKEHRFTSREAVLAIFVTSELADRITKISPAAGRVSRDEPM